MWKRRWKLDTLRNNIYIYIYIYIYREREIYIYIDTYAIIDIDCRYWNIVKFWIELSSFLKAIQLNRDVDSSNADSISPYWLKTRLNSSGRESSSEGGGNGRSQSRVSIAIRLRQSTRSVGESVIVLVSRGQWAEVGWARSERMVFEVPNIFRNIALLNSRLTSWNSLSKMYGGERFIFELKNLHLRANRRTVYSVSIVKSRRFRRMQILIKPEQLRVEAYLPGTSTVSHCTILNSKFIPRKCLLLKMEIKVMELGIRHGAVRLQITKSIKEITTFLRQLAPEMLAFPIFDLENLGHDRGEQHSQCCHWMANVTLYKSHVQHSFFKLSLMVSEELTFKNVDLENN